MTDYWPSGSYRIFISYARDDSHDIALQLRSDLAAAGHDAWLDVAEIAAGSSWARDIEEAIEYCDLALALLSHGSYVSDICRGEQLRALRKNKRVIPVMVQADADRPLHLENLNYVEFSDLTRYDQLFADLLTYIETGTMPETMAHGGPVTGSMPIFPPPKTRNKAANQAISLKRDARAFRRYLEDLREEEWLGERHWWTYLLFYFANVTDIARILVDGIIMAPEYHNQRARMWDRFVRLNFRPRTPDLFGHEGILPESERRFGHCAVPLYLLFDLEAIVTMSAARFSPGDITQTGKSVQSATAFRDLPFDLIYHDEPFSRHERDEILMARRAQVLVPKSLGLEHLRHIWCRSAAEAETLHYLLPDKVWRRFEERVTIRTDYELFNRQRLFVFRATLTLDGAHFVFNPCQNPDTDECGPFEVRAEIKTADEQKHVIDLGEFVPDDEMALDLTEFELGAYELRLYLDDALAYVGRSSEATN